MKPCCKWGHHPINIKQGFISIRSAKYESFVSAYCEQMVTVASNSARGLNIGCPLRVGNTLV